MTLEEAIKHCEEVAEEQEKMGERNYDDDCLECAKDHRQLAEWLKELQKYREMLKNEPQIRKDVQMYMIREGEK